MIEQLCSAKRPAFACFLEASRGASAGSFSWGAEAAGRPAVVEAARGGEVQQLMTGGVSGLSPSVSAGRGRQWPSPSQLHAVSRFRGYVLCAHLGSWQLDPSHHALASLWAKILTTGGPCCRAPRVPLVASAVVRWEAGSRLPRTAVFHRAVAQAGSTSCACARMPARPV